MLMKKEMQQLFRTWPNLRFQRCFRRYQVNKHIVVDERCKTYIGGKHEATGRQNLQSVIK
jgi:hypothetical protein